MRIQVGIHENVVIRDAAVNDKGRLVVYLRKKGEDTAPDEDDPMAAMAASEVIEKDNASGLTFWPLKVPEVRDTKNNKDRTDKERGEIANQDCMQLKNQLTQILEQFLVKDNIQWSPYEGTPLTKETYYEDMASQATLDLIYRNLCDQFIAMINPFLNDEKYAVRFKLVRQSKDKHFARVPGMYIKDNPFIELMDVPEKQSRVKWTEYEKNNGFNDGTPVSRNTADQEEEEPKEGDNVFGQR